jgi:hypothetical protein
MPVFTGMTVRSSVHVSFRPRIKYGVDSSRNPVFLLPIQDLWDSLSLPGSIWSIDSVGRGFPMPDGRCRNHKSFELQLHNGAPIGGSL